MIKAAMNAKAGETKGFILDGFPLNMSQAKLFEEKIGSPSRVLVLNVNDIILKERLAKRSNFDDQPDAVDKRIATWNNQTKPVVKEYEKIVANVSHLVISLLSADTFRILHSNVSQYHMTS